MKISALRFILCAAVAIILSLNASAQTQAGQIKAAKTDGEVMKLNKDGTSVQVHDNDPLTETDVITTGKGASVVIVFMNGSSVKLGANSRLAIDEFKMDPLADDVKMSDYNNRDKNEPSVSKTALNLSYGELVGDVKHLNKSSSYSIKTPVGAAGIRGTIFRIVYTPSADGKAFFTVSTAEGLVVMQGVTKQEIPIAQNKEVVVTVDIPTTSTTPGQPPPPPAAPVIVTQDIPAATAAIITTASTNIATVVQATVFTPTTTSTPPATPPDTTPKPDDKKDDKKTDTPPPTPPPPTTTTPPVLTPGAGG
jgi:hypothetical protein